MKTLTISATLALLTTFVHAVPINSARQFQLVVVIDQGAPTKPAPLADNKITFFGGAPGQSFDQTIPSTDSQDDTEINNEMIVYSIKNAGSAVCTFTGVKGSSTTVQEGETENVTLPQAQVSAICFAYY